MKRMTILLLLLAALSSQIAAQSYDRNFVLTRTFLDEQQKSSLDSYLYLDDLGREEQQLQSKFTPRGRDLVTAIQYDSIGRKCRQYIPVASDKLNGSYQRDIFSHAQSVSGDMSPFSEIVYEDSPLNRVFSETGAGHDWYEAKKGKRNEYFINDMNADGIFYARNYNVSSNYVLSEALAAIYREGELKVVLSVDEDNDSTLSFTDKQERTILVRQRNKGISHDTYYAYDDGGNLCYVLPPMLEGRTDNSLLSLYAYSYKYDYRDRCIEKKLPGCAPIYLIYDRSDHVILEQDGKQRSNNRWTVRKYDHFGRILYTYEHTDSTSLVTLRAQLEGERIIERVTPFSGSSDPLAIGYTMEYFATGTDRQLLTVNYYDDYAYLNTFSTAQRQLLSYQSKLGYASQFGNATGFLTGVRQYLLDGSGSYLSSALYYDVKGRVVQSRNTNITGGYDYNYFLYSFAGNPLKHFHQQTNRDGIEILNEEYTYTYDHANRPKDILHSVNGNKAVILCYNQYDEYGRLQKKSLHDLNHVYTYDYNIRDWLTGITGNNFHQILRYQNDNINPCYNGNISSIAWMSGQETLQRSYCFEYDGMNRLTNAIYGEGDNATTNINRFNERVRAYDKHGNILKLERYGQTSPTTYGLIDDLTLNYTGNMLRNVTDNAFNSAYNDSFEFKNGAEQENEYVYDENGNLTKDLNKKIIAIQYNCLNLPSRIAFEDGSTISYTYSMDGRKLRTVHVIAGVTTTTDYCGNVIFENEAAKTLLTEAGYISLDDNKYHYYLQDHQGNNCMVLNQNGTVEEVNHYYPFGGLMANTASAQPYKYNGKELDTKGGLNLYDYGARHYDPAIGRFMTMDPMAEKYYGWSPYTYCLGNPVRFIDPTGMVTETPPGFWASFGKGFSQPFVNFWNAVSHPVETATSIVNSVKGATPFEIGFGVGEQMLGSPISPFSGALKQLDVVQAMAYDKINGTMTSAEVVGSQWGDITFDGATISIGAGVGKVIGTLGKEGSGVAKGTTILSKGEVLRIQNAATKINKPIHVVGSRASGRVGPYSDWDYIIGGLTNKDWKSIKNSLPGSKSIIDNTPRNIDIIKEQLDVTKPYIKINPK